MSICFFILLFPFDNDWYFKNLGLLPSASIFWIRLNQVRSDHFYLYLSLIFFELCRLNLFSLRKPKWAWQWNQPKKKIFEYQFYWFFKPWITFWMAMLEQNMSHHFKSPNLWNLVRKGIWRVSRTKILNNTLFLKQEFPQPIKTLYFT